MSEKKVEVGRHNFAECGGGEEKTIEETSQVQSSLSGAREGARDHSPCHAGYGVGPLLFEEGGGLAGGALEEGAFPVEVEEGGFCGSGTATRVSRSRLSILRALGDMKTHRQYKAHAMQTNETERRTSVPKCWGSDRAAATPKIACFSMHKII